MTDFERFDQNVRSRGVLIDTNLFVLLIAGFVNRDRIAKFKRIANYTPADWDLLVSLPEPIPLRYALPHVLAALSILTDMKGPKNCRFRVDRHACRRTIRGSV
ncbi:MAG: hypothetical protein EXQ52_14380 [Bryobacterales bacterium]|nr:hypothetical protein [Bryobacterales bacterium]